MDTILVLKTTQTCNKRWKYVNIVLWTSIMWKVYKNEKKAYLMENELYHYSSVASTGDKISTVQTTEAKEDKNWFLRLPYDNP